MDFIKQADSKLREFFASFKIIYAYVLTDIEKKPRSFKIGVFSIFIVVCFLVLLQSVLYLTPLIFIKLAEEQNGHYDLTITPIAADDDPRSSEGTNIPVIRAVNFTALESQLGDMPEIAGMSPRWLLPVRVANPKNPDKSFQAVSIILDSERERKYGIGKQLDVPDLKRQECWISSTVQRLLGLENNEVTLSLDLLGALSKLETISIGGEASFSEGFIQHMVKDFIKNRFGEGKLKIDFDQFGLNKGAVQAALTVIKTTLPLATKSDGTINFELLNTMLILAQAIPQALPLENLGAIQASSVLSLLELAEDFIENGSVDIDPEAIADTAVPILLSALKLRENFAVTAVVDKPRGKWPEELGNVIIIDSNYVIDAVVESFINALKSTKFETGNPALDILLLSLAQAPQIEENILNSIGKVDISEYSLTVNILLNNRPQIYASQETVRPQMINITNQIYTKLGRDHPTTVSSSIEIIMTGLFIFKHLLDNVFNATVFILLLLSILLIYSLMHSSVEEKTYEFGMLRALGMKQSSLIILLGLQSLFFAIPGLILGLILAFAVNTVISYLIFDYTALAITYNLSKPALVTGFSIALFVPLASNIIPIRRALSKTLKDSLNLYHRTISDMTVRILKLAQLGISPAQTVGALTLIILGFLTYYVAPYSFIFANLTLFFFIMTIVLMLLIIGFTIILNLVQSPSERGILKLIMMLYPQDRVLEPVIVKNLAAHKNRNTKTSLMFSIALSFLIYSGTSFRLNSSLIVDQLKAGLGADIVIKTVPFEKSSLKEADLRQALEQFKEKFPKAIRGYGFASQPLSRQPEVPGAKLSNLAGIPTGRVEIISVDEEFLRASYDEYYLPSELDMTLKNEYFMKTGKIDGVKSLYRKEGLEKISDFDGYNITSNADARRSPDLNNMIGEEEIRLMIPSGTALQLSTDVGTPGLLQFGDRKFRTKIRSTAVKFPGFYFTGYRTLWKINVITSHEDYRYITDKIYSTGGNAHAIQKFKDNLPPNTSYGVPKHHLLVRLNDGVDTETRLNLFNMLQTMVDGQFSFVLDVAGTALSMQDSLVFIDVFFVLVSIIAISLSFFFTIVSFVSNISESSWEFGILRAVGLNKNQMSKVYIFEALSIIVAAGVLGTIVGIIVALTTTIQFNLFTELPFRFLFPVVVFLFTLTLSVLTAVYGSKTAVDDIKHRQIASIIKSLD